MVQNVNLLTEINVRPAAVLNSRLMVRISASWILLLMVIYVIGLGVGADKKHTLASLEEKQKGLQTQINTYQKYLVQFQTGELALDLHGLTNSLGNTRGFYGYLNDLATYTPHGVWLTGISIAETDGSIAIEGGTIASSGVTALLEAIDSAPSFDDKKFDNVSINKKPNSGEISFTISNTNVSESSETTIAKKPTDKIKEVNYK